MPQPALRHGREIARRSGATTPAVSITQILGRVKLREVAGASFVRATLPAEKRASSPDSPLEGTGFEPSVPRERLVLSFSFTPTFPLARVNRPDPIQKAYYDRAVKALGHVGITDVITLMGYYTSNDPGLLRRPGRGAGNGALKGARSQSPALPSGESSRNGFGRRAPPIRIAEHSRDPGACRSYHGPVCS